MKSKGVIRLLLLLSMAYSCEKLEIIKPSGFETVIDADSIVFAEIGDFGYAGTHERRVANMVKSWSPDFIISVGDNNYYEGKLSTIAANITDYYGDYIYNYDAPAGYRCNGKAFDDQVNRFFPTPGNHDADNKDGLIPYYNYFTLPGIEMYYKFTWGPVTFYSLNTSDGDLNEQKAWLEQQLVITDSTFNIVFFHYPPYSSGSHGNNTTVQWDFYGMGVDLVFTGHEHIYDRIEKKGEENMYYIVNGLGGKEIGKCGVHPLSTDDFDSFCYGGDFGAARVVASYHKLTLSFYALCKPTQPVDTIEILKR